eukprot:scaffold72264_cov13-Tisochrysis_lutea.AAC.1
MRLSGRAGSAVYAGELEAVEAAPESAATCAPGGVLQEGVSGLTAVAEDKEDEKGACQAQQSVEFSFDYDKGISMLKSSAPPPPVPSVSSPLDSMVLKPIQQQQEQQQQEQQQQQQQGQQQGQEQLQGVKHARTPSHASP